MGKKQANIFSEEVHQRVLARIRARTPEDWKRVVEQQPELPEDWPSLVEVPGGAPVLPNGKTPKRDRG